MPLSSPIEWLAFLFLISLISFFLYAVLIYPHHEKISKFYHSLKKKFPKW